MTIIQTEIDDKTYEAELAEIEFTDDYDARFPKRLTDIQKLNLVSNLNYFLVPEEGVTEYICYGEYPEIEEALILKYFQETENDALERQIDDEYFAQLD